MRDNRTLMVIGGTVVLILGLAAFFLSRGCNADGRRSDSRRENTLSLVRTYTENGEYDRAMDLLNDLLIDNADDDEARALLEDLVARSQKDGSLSDDRTLDADESSDSASLADSTGGADFNLNADAQAQREQAEREQAEAAERQKREDTRRREASQYVTQGRNDLANNRFEEALAAANAALGILPGYVPAVQLEDDARKAQRDTESAAERRARQEKEAQLVDLLNRSARAIEEKRWNEARDLASQAQNLAPSSARAFSLEGDAWYGENPDSAENRRKAKSAYNLATSRDPRDWKSYYTLGKIAQADNDIPGAIQALETAVEIKPDLAEALFELGKLQYRTRRYNDARLSFRRVSQLDPDTPGNWFNLGLSSVKTNRLDEARKSFSENIKIRPGHAASHYEIGKIYMLTSDWSNASQSFIMASNLAPDRNPYWRSLGASYFESGQFRDARKAYQKALELAPDDGTSLYNLAIIALQLDDNQQALENAVAAVRSDGSNPVYLYTLGEAAEKMGLDDQAVAAYERSAALDLEYAKPRINLGVYYDKAGDYQKALDYGLEALQIESNSPTIWNNLGRAYLHTENYGQSLAFFEKAAAAQPKNPDFQLNLGLALTETGDNSRAIDVFKRVISLDPGSTEAYDRLVRLQLAMGDRRGATTTFRQLESAVPDYPDLGQLKALVQ